MKFLQYIFLIAFISFGIIACSNDSTVDDNNMNTGNIIWNGSPLSFEKADGADPELPENQDMLSSNVVLTRANDGGQIYNIAVESSSDKEESPTGTLWALGTTADIDNLDFQNFRTTIKPKEVVGKDLVLHLVADNVYRYKI